MNSPEKPNDPSSLSEQPSDWDSLSTFKFIPSSSFPSPYFPKNDTLKDDRAAKAAEYEKKRHLANLQKIEKLSHLSPAEQLRYLSDIWEEAEADTWYAVTDGKDLFYTIDGDTRFSPFIQLVAKAAKSSDPDDYYDDIELPQNINENYGYDSVIRPDELPYESDPEINSLTETEIKTKLNQARIDMDEETPPPRPYADWFSYESDLELALARIYYTQNQKRLHKEFPSLPNHTGQLIRIAPDAAISVSFQKKYDYDVANFPWSSSLSALSDDRGRIASMTEAENNKPNSLGLGKDMLTYLEAVHCNPDIKYTIEKTLNLQITEIPLASQVHLLKFMIEADSTRYDNLCQTLKNTPEDIRLKLAEAFLAADFGPDFGDSLLDIANSDRFTPDQVADILISIDSCRSSIKDIANLYKDFDNGQFAEQYSRAANERLTDALTVFRKIAEHGEASADLGWTGQASFDFNSALEALNYEAKSLSIISNTVDDVASGKPEAFSELCFSDEDKDHSYFHLYSPDHGHILLYVRPDASSTFDPSYEYGKFRNRYSEETSHQGGIEASISFIVDPIDPYHLPDYHRPNYSRDPHAQNKVSALRIDREGRAPGAPANDPNRSPLNPIGMISVDLAAINDTPDTPSGKIARLFSVGNKLRQQALDTEYTLNHNTNWFNQEQYGTTTGFKSLADYMQKSFHALCLAYPPKDTSVPNYTSILKQKPTSRRRTSSRPRSGPIRITNQAA